MYHAKWAIPEDMLFKFTPVSLPEGAEGVTAQLIADLYDLVLSFGMKKQSDVKIYSYKNIMVVIDPTRNNLAVGGGKGEKNKWVSIDLNEEGYLHWDANLKIEDVICLINETDEKCGELDFVDPITKERMKLDMSGKSVEFVMDRIFGDAKMSSEGVDERLLSAMDSLRRTVKEKNLTLGDFDKNDILSIKDKIKELMRPDDEDLPGSLLKEISSEIFASNKLSDFSSLDPDNRKGKVGKGFKKDRPKGFQKDGQGEKNKVDETFKIPGTVVPLLGRKAEDFLQKFDRPEELEVVKSPMGEEVISLKRDREHNKEREEAVNQILQEKGLTLEDVKSLPDKQILEIREETDRKLGRPIPSKLEEALSQILPERVVEDCGDYKVDKTFSKEGAGVVLASGDDPKKKKEKFDKPNDVAIINYAPTGTKILCHKRDIGHFKRRMRAMEAIIKERGVGKKVSQEELQEIRAEIDNRLRS